MVLTHASPFADHFGASRTYENLRRRLVWPNMIQDVKKFCSECEICQKLKPKWIKPFDLIHTSATYPFQTVYIDFLGPFSGTVGMKYVLVMLDGLSRYVELESTLDTKSSTVVNVVTRRILCRWGIPVKIVFDGSASFKNEFAALCLRMKIGRHLSTPGYPQSHGIIERMNRVILQVLRSYLTLNVETTGDMVLCQIQFAINSAKNRITGVAPFRVVHGFDPIVQLD